MSSTPGIIYKSSNYKYRLCADYTCATPLRPPTAVTVPGGWVTLAVDGTITLKKDYLWDGASGPAPDVASIMRGSLVHDGLYQLLRSTQLGDPDGPVWSRNRDAADTLFRHMCIADGMWPLLAWVVYLAVAIGGVAAAKPKPPPERRRAPVTPG
jgi:hypothetical protein